MESGLRPIKISNSSLSSQAQKYLRDLINQGVYTPGEKLPPEGNFADQLGISRPTLREALHNLEMDGAIIRKHGVGTFVSPAYNKRIDSGLEVLESIERIANRMGLETTIGEIEIEERPPLPLEMKGLNRDSLDTILSVMRTILIDEHPVALLQDCIPLEYLSKKDLGDGFNGSILELFLQRGKPALAYSFTLLGAAPATHALARTLKLPLKTSLMKFEAQLYAVENRVVDFSVSYFVSDYFLFHVIRHIEK